MFKIFADALLIAARVGHHGENGKRRIPHEIQDIESLRALDTLRQPLR